MVNQYKKQRRYLKEKRRQEKQIQKNNKPLQTIVQEQQFNTAFVLGNGTSRATVDLEKLRNHGNIYGCNALYRSFSPDYLIAVDSKMIFEISKAGYQNHNSVWTNPNKSYEKIPNLNFFKPSKGWSSGPTALHLASEHQFEHIYILGFDYRGLNDGKTVNNIYAGTPNYKKVGERATFFGNWLKQTITTVKNHSHIKYTRVINTGGHIPKDLVNISNLNHITVEDFIKKFNLK